MTAVQLVIDCAEPARLVDFWAVALDYVPAPPPEGHGSWREFYLAGGVPEEELPDGDACDRVVDPTGVGPALWFQVVPERKATKNRMHLDVLVGGGRAVPLAERRSRVDARVAALVARGAEIVHEHDGAFDGHHAVTLRDPEGNEFCVV